MGAYLSHLVGKLLGSDDAKLHHSEIDHSAVICCGGTMNVTEIEHEHSKEEEEENEAHR